MTLRGAIAACLAISASSTLLWASTARAGEYYVYACSTYGNRAPAFTPDSGADHINTADGCMEPAPNGGYRSLEINNPTNAPVVYGRGANWTAYSPSSALSIVGAYTPVNTVLVDCHLHMDGFTAEFLWGGGTQAIDYINDCNSSAGYGYGTGINITFAPSSYFGWGAGCWLASSCASSSSIGAVLGVNGVRLTVQENSGPSLIADGSNNLWYQGGHWIRGGGWPVTVTGTDPSGVCGTYLLVNGSLSSAAETDDTSPDSSNFIQCWPSDTGTGTLDTRSYANGPLSIQYLSNNAANVFSAPSETLQVDNTPVTLSLSTPNDDDPNVWVDHSVNVLAAASAGPSGVQATTCSTDSGSPYSYPSRGITLNGTGVWTVSCSSQNDAYDVNGQPGSSPPQTVRVRIDETPPTVGFAPIDPADPQAVVVNTSDGQSGVAGGQIQMRPADGSDWIPLSTGLDGSHLRAHFDDSTMTPGPWVVQATACDKAGNCATTTETVTLPVRTSSIAMLGLKPFGEVDARCITRKAKGHRRRAKATCHMLHPRAKKQERITFGKRIVLHGLLMTGQGTPISGAPVAILAAPDNGLARYTEIASASTDSGGSWTVTLPPGPSRLLTAAYAGSPTIQPSRASSKLVVPAAVRVLKVWPSHVGWGDKVHIKARLLGGYLPPGGALVRLRLGYGNAKITYGVREHVAGNGIFEVTNTFGPGPPGLVRHYWLQECTLPESNYPFAPACSRRSGITVGG